MKKTLIFFLRAVIFLVILALLLHSVQDLLSRKSLEGAWSMTEKIGGFYNEPENEFDVMFFGSSHAYASFSPLELWKHTGVKSYVFATQQQPIWATYTYLKEALKTQSPSLVVVECQMLFSDEAYYDDGVVYSYMDDLRFSWDKVQLAWQSSPDFDTRVELLCNLFKYHGRWSELSEADWHFDRSALRDPLKGHVCLWDTQEAPYRPLVDDITNRVPLMEKNEYWLRQIIALCETEGLELWLVKSPSNLLEDEKPRLNTISDIAAEHGIYFHDFNSEYEDIGLSPEVFFDVHHLDGMGAALFTDYFAGYLASMRPELCNEATDNAWQADLDTYEEKLKAWQSQETDTPPDSNEPGEYFTSS